MISYLFSNVTLDLVVQSDTVVFHGNQDSASSKLLFGKVILKVTKKTKISSLRVVASGVTQFWFSKNSIAQYSVSISTRDIYHAEKIQNCGNLPESVYTTYGSTEYSLKAILETSSYLPSITKQIPIYIGRIPHSGPPTFMPDDGPNDILKKFEEKLSVKLNTPSKCYSENQTIDLVADISLMNPNIKIVSVGARINEYTTITDIKNQNTKKFIVKMITSEKRNLDSTDQNSKYLDFSELGFEMVLPQAYKNIQHNIETDVFFISHQIHFDINIEIDGASEKLRTSLPLLVVPNEYFSEMLSLPKYSPKT
ncbi:hypothetical protein BB559_004880 [Furculomyces boomerangus]|uniref:Arrestin C-terminal-like domain-containing protein n=1 Tax=Furculomyces boomerangus TaxID=61424 RepID=A0A2T9YC21_9FUNG|nr:hypothetical protein BB559_004880 [Furculomyces boomerangus]